MKTYRSQNVLFFENETPSFGPGSILVDGEKIIEVKRAEKNETSTSSDVTDFGDSYLIPGIVDSHAHINEPGRTDWEGFETATKAAAAGGITTVIDMPLNSIPATTSLKALEIKMKEASTKCKIDYGFWGGVIPGNENELEAMAQNGVRGFKAFMCPSGVDEFPMSTPEVLYSAMKILARLKKPLIVHAELESATSFDRTQSKTYNSYLKSRPDQFELSAIDILIDLCEKTGCHTHIVHLSTAQALEKIAKAKTKGLPLTVETCPHYLCFESESIEQGQTYFKCAPPIRSKKNQDMLWNGLSTIDCIVSDHSPCTVGLKCLESGDFEKAWGGISGIQFSLVSTLTEAFNRKLSLAEVLKKMTLNTAKLVGLDRQKGKLEKGFDADFAVIKKQDFKLENESQVFHKNKVTPYFNQKFSFKVTDTYLRGSLIYNEKKDQLNGQTESQTSGKALR